MNKLVYVVGNIVDDHILDGKDALVLPTNPKMRYGMGVSEVVFKKAGIDALEKYCELKYGVGYDESQIKNDMKPTEIRSTPGFGIGRDIIFVQSPNDIYFDIKEKELFPLLIKTYRNLLDFIKDKGYKNVLMPSLGTGHYGFSHDQVVEKIIPNMRTSCLQIKIC